MRTVNFLGRSLFEFIDAKPDTSIIQEYLLRTDDYLLFGVSTIVGLLKLTGGQKLLLRFRP